MFQATDTIALTNSFFLLSVAMHPDIQVSFIIKISIIHLN